MSRKLSTYLAAAVALLLVAAESSFAATFNARGSVEQVYVTDATPDASVTLLNSSDQAIRNGTVNDLGGALFREVAPGPGYKVQIGAETSDPLTVMTKQSAPPDTSVYNQSITPDGYGYMEMRDGVKLAYSTHPPSDLLGVLATAGIPIPPALNTLLTSLPIFTAAPGTIETPTLIEYSGYATARPSGPESGISILANLMGYTVVDVSMRGTGCSGGAYDFFEPLQGLDGYDVIETVARQPWVKGDKVGMFGISFGGISQLFTAQYQPPSLAAISPLSVIDQTQTTLYPGGVLNTGFAYSWAVDRVHDAQPAPDGQPWANDQIAVEGPGGPCQANQALHPEAASLLDKIDENDYYVPEVADPLSPKTFVDKINVPTYLNCQWTDEQTGGHCPTLASRLTGTDKKWVTFTNGTHVDSLAPESLTRLYNFLEIYVNEEAPATKAALVNLGAPLIYVAGFGITGVTPQAGPDHAEPGLQLGEDRVGVPEADPDRLRQRRRRLHRRAPVSGVQPRLRLLPRTGHDRPLLVPRRRRDADGRAAGPGGRRRLRLRRRRRGGDQLHGRHRRRHRRHLDRHAAVSVEPGPRRHGGRVRDRAARRRHDGARLRRRRRLGPLLEAERRPRGDRQRDPSRRQGDLRAGRLDARRRARPRPGEEHRARARS